MSDIILENGDVIFESGDVSIEGLTGLTGTGAISMLFPLELGETNNADMTLEENKINDVRQAAQTLLTNFFPDMAVELLPDWERLLGLTVAEGDTITERQAKCVAKLRSSGGLSIPYYISVALNYGYGIEIRELSPFIIGIDHMGGRLYGPGIYFLWEVLVLAETSPVIGHDDLEERLLDLKPAHTDIRFVWPD